jgi:hypothetical protein
MFGWFIWYMLMMSDSSRGGRLLPTPPKHLMSTRPERPVKKSKKKKKK